MTDLYEMTMMQGYFKTQNHEVVVFDAFYRNNPCDGGYAICAGLDQVIEYIKDLHFDENDLAYLKSLNIFDDDFLEYLANFHFSGDIYAIPEGTVIFPREPISTVSRNSYFKYFKPPVSDRYEISQSLLCSKR